MLDGIKIFATESLSSLKKGKDFWMKGEYERVRQFVQELMSFGVDKHLFPATYVESGWGAKGSYEVQATGAQILKGAGFGIGRFLCHAPYAHISTTAKGNTTNLIPRNVLRLLGVSVPEWMPALEEEPGAYITTAVRRQPPERAQVVVVPPYLRPIEGTTTHERHGGRIYLRWGEIKVNAPLYYYSFEKTVEGIEQSQFAPIQWDWIGVDIVWVFVEKHSRPSPHLAPTELVKLLKEPL